VRSIGKLPQQCRVNSVSCLSYVLWNRITSPEESLVQRSCGSSTPDSAEWVKDGIAFSRQSEDESLRQPDRKLARVIDLLDVVCLDVRDVVLHILRVLPSRVR